MRPPFSNALYYPNIDIQNHAWLKTAILFWDSISTIVPESLSQPYKHHDTQYLADIGFLRPLYVNSNDKSVVGIEEDIINLLFSSEIIQNICAPQNNRYSNIWDEKMSYKVKDELKHLSNSGIYSEKMSRKIQKEIKHLKYDFDNPHIYFFNEKFAYIYMIVLANKLCEDHSLGMVTDDIPCFNMGNIIRFGNQTTIHPENRFLNMRPRDHQLEQGLLLNCIISELSISPNTSFEDIITFKNHYKDELARFRTQLAKLTQNFDLDKPIDILQQEISDLYNNEFTPAFNDFKAALTSSKIKWFTNSFLKISLLSTGATGVPMALLKMPVEQALFAGMGVSIIASTISYNVDKIDFLRNNPYSYLYMINHNLG
ncbi:MAG: hypothetical protein HDR19_06465 [Lachnospiraceae bacterium]|nr:hypothetical protein [Lachnospiraceae bacterium]